ncbi:hypothetical protein D3C73_1338730 [compost metagenome]
MHDSTKALKQQLNPVISPIDMMNLLYNRLALGRQARNNQCCTSPEIRRFYRSSV